MTGKTKTVRPSTLTDCYEKFFFLDWVQQVSRNLSYKYPMNIATLATNPVIEGTAFQAIDYFLFLKSEEDMP